MYDIGIIGAGPAGYTAAIRAAQYGFSVVLFEKKDIGGTCLNKGCIPTKTLLHCSELFSSLKSVSKFGITIENPTFDYSKMIDRKDTVVSKMKKSLTQLISSYEIEIVETQAQITSQNTIEAGEKSYECKNIIIATGSRPNKIKFEGTYDDNFVLNSDEILETKDLGENILIVGSGAIGIEWTRIFAKLGKKVTLVELADKLIPIADSDVSNRIERILKRDRVKFFTSTSISKIEGKSVTLSNDTTQDFDRVLVAIGRAPNIPENEFGSTIEHQKFVTTDHNFKTNYENVYAIGDINGLSMLAHSASHQALEVIEYIKNKKEGSFDKNLVPSVIYGSPEIAWVGRTEQDLETAGISYKKSFIPVAALGKAYADDKIEGFIKILANESEILGAHIISEEASALVQEIAIAITDKISPKKLSEVIFAHPTYSEGVFEAILGLDNLSINLPQTQNN